ncbi:HNH endonuclease [Sphingomonas faeni]|uniref:HNH endonuclease n=1 Tax=Sphingomonas faeni TaxID=185950 RepID=UPI0033647166
MKAVFDTRPGSGYSDSATAYDFPARYFRQATASIGDWVVYYEPSREGGRRSYVGTARLGRIDPNPAVAGRFLGAMEDYLPFDVPVPLRNESTYREALLRSVTDPRAIGRTLQGQSVRLLSDQDFVSIINHGFSQTLEPNNARRLGLQLPELDIVTASLLEDPLGERQIEKMLTNRTIRNAAFRRSVLDAYGDTCAVTGLRLINGGGRAEAQAAHIVPVAEKGLDIVQNGIALSATAHWLFDRHLISIGEDWQLLVSHNRVPAELRTLFARHENRIGLPRDSSKWPHPDFVARHRDRFASR